MWRRIVVAVARTKAVATASLLCLVATALASGEGRWDSASRSSGVAVPASHAGLIEEPTFLTIRGRSGSYRLEAIIVRKAHAEGRLPIALITHGKQKLASEMMALRADVMLPQARDLAYRGYLAVAVVRRGFGRSDGVPGVAAGARYARCTVPDLRQYFAAEADDLDGALWAVAERADADPARAIAIGQSVGGGAVLALAARSPRGLAAAINVSGGVRLTRADGLVCAPEVLVAAIASYARTTRIPTLWLYAENDTVFGPDLAYAMRDSYVAAGGTADLRMFDPVEPEGHNLFTASEGRIKWLAAADAFLRARALPTWSAAEADTVLRAGRLPAASRPAIESYLSVYTPKVLVVGPNRTLFWAANTRDLARARESGLDNCRKRTRAECRIVMENFNLVASDVETGSRAGAQETVSAAGLAP